MTLRSRWGPRLRPLFQAWWRLSRGMTLGVRGMVIDEAGRVLLVQHTYVGGWHMPGGGVEKGECAGEALARELVEEAGVELTGPPALIAVHANHASFPNDHVLVFRIEHWRACAATSHGEISALAWFAPDALPDDTNPSTRRWIEAALFGTPP